MKRTWFFHLQTVHSSFSTSFLVVLAFFLRMGLDWPPKPCCLRSYLGINNKSEEEVKTPRDPFSSFLGCSVITQRHGGVTIHESRDFVTSEAR